ncbi:methyl-accepting chemotaxis protein, partial [Pseudomonas syringae pv. actinidiae ICMP 19100]
MGSWLGNLSLKYKFWAVNAVAFFTTLLLVLFALQLEQQARAETSREAAQAQARLLTAWPADKPLPSSDTLLVYTQGQAPALNGLALPELASGSGW